ncbi:MAG: ATP-dependent DNA ligase [Candidatus Korobacteraceae bacterium]
MRNRTQNRHKPKAREDISGAVAAKELQAPFPSIELPIQPPFPPMEARVRQEIPSGDQWFYEPKWDGFRCLVFRNDEQVLLQSKAGQPLGRYFPELVHAFCQVKAKRFVLDGEIVIFMDGQPSFEDLLLRIHPAASRIHKLSMEIPASIVLFDLLVDETGQSLLALPLEERRRRLEEFARRQGIKIADPKTSLRNVARPGTRLLISPVTREHTLAERWMANLAGAGFDGVVAKRADATYASGERTAMVKIKRIRTADCVVGGFRYSSKGNEVGSLLLGLYNDAGELDHIGFTSSFNSENRAKLKVIVEKYKDGSGFTGRAPGGPSRWATERSAEWEPLRPELVCEVAYDHFSQGRFRHGAKFLRWRPDKSPRQCTMEQVQKPDKRHERKTSEIRRAGWT